MYRFSPISNKKAIPSEKELRVLIATDVLSEGQNLQDGFIIVNYDLPWTIIRLIQRAGRVDRIGQRSDKILCYSFLPAEGIERIIRLRAKVRARLHANSEVVGTDESFFDDDRHNKAVTDLYHEKAGLLDGEDDSEVDLVSYAYQIRQDAITANPALKKTIENMPNVVYTAKERLPPRLRVTRHLRRRMHGRIGIPLLPLPSRLHSERRRIGLPWARYRYRQGFHTFSRQP